MFAKIPFRGDIENDAAWISSDRLDALTVEDTGTAFWHVCPSVVIEVASEWNRWSTLMRKINRFMRNGAVYAVAVDPVERRVYELGTPPIGLELDFEAIFNA